MDEDVARLARRAAGLLSAEQPDLPPLVEAEIQRDEGPPATFDPATLIGLAGLVLTAAKFAYDIRRDRKKDRQLAPEALKRRVRVMLDERGYPDTLNRAKAIEAVVQAVQEAER